MTDAGALDIHYRPTWRIWLRAAGSAWNVVFAVAVVWIGVSAILLDDRRLIVLLAVVLVVVGVAFFGLSVRRLIRTFRRAGRRSKVLALDEAGISFVTGPTMLSWDDCAAIVVSDGPWPRAAKRGVSVVQFVAVDPAKVKGDAESRYARGMAALLGISAADGRTTCVITRAMTHGVGDVLAFARLAKPGVQILSARSDGLDLKDA